MSPRNYDFHTDDGPWAADNDAFSEFHEERYLAMVEAIKGREGCLFVTAPDVVGDRDATLERWQLWYPLIADRDLPAAYVCQDGENGSTIPFGAKAAFIGGTTNYKMSADAVSAAQDAKARGLWVHMGRVNTLRRIRFAHSIGVDSIDGTNWSRFTDTYKHQLRVLPFRQEALS